MNIYAAKLSFGNYKSSEFPIQSPILGKDVVKYRL